MASKLLFLHTVPNSRERKDVLVKIIQKANNKIFWIKFFLKPFFKIVIDLFYILPLEVK